MNACVACGDEFLTLFRYQGVRLCRFCLRLPTATIRARIAKRSAA